MISIRVKYRTSTVPNKEGVIYYQLIQNRITRQITTSYKLFPREWDSESSIINITKSEYHRRSYLQNIERQIMRDITNLQRVATQSNDVEKTIESYATLSKSYTLTEFTKQIASELKNEWRTKTASSYLTALRSFLQFKKGADIGFDEIKPHLIKQYEQHLKARNICNNSISFYMRILRAIYNRAVEENLTEQSFPFKGVYVGIDKTVKRAVDEDIISRLKVAELSKNKGLAFARDMFLFSFYCRGMAFVDVAHLTNSNIKGDYIVYQRHKTGQELSIRIEPCLKNIIARYSDADSRYLLPILTTEKIQLRECVTASKPAFEKYLRDDGVKNSSDLVCRTAQLGDFGKTQGCFNSNHQREYGAQQREDDPHLPILARPLGYRPSKRKAVVGVVMSM